MCEQCPSTTTVSGHSTDRRVLKVLVSRIRFVLNVWAAALGSVLPCAGLS